MKRAIANVLVVLFLLVAQQAAYAHTLSHTDHRSPAGQDKPLPHTKICGQCALSAQLGNGLVGNPTILLSGPAAACTVAGRPQIVYLTAPRRFLSRAPPTLL
jgi:hypothetical protein